MASNPFEAMAHLVRSLDESVPAAHRGMALVIVEPREHQDGALQGMLASLARYAPLTTLWAYDKDASPRLHSFVPGDSDGHVNESVEIYVAKDVEKQAIEASRMRRERSMGKPPLRLTGDGQIPADVELGDEIDPSKLMSQDELSMLLDDDMDNG